MQIKSMLKITGALILCAVLLSACGLPADGGNPGNNPGQNSDQDDIYEMEAIVLNEEGGSLLFYTLGENYNSLVSVNTSKADITTADGFEISAGELLTGQIVTISYDGIMADSYPGQIFNCYSIRVSGEAQEATLADAMSKYSSVFTSDAVIYYVTANGSIAEKTVTLTFGGSLEEWRTANNLPEGVSVTFKRSEDNSYTETTDMLATHYAPTVADLYYDLSPEFLTALIASENETALVASLAKTIIGKNPSAANTGVYFTVNGSPLITAKNDFSGRICFDTYG